MAKRGAGGTPRSTARLAAVQALYQMEISGGDVELVITEFAGHRLTKPSTVSIWSSPIARCSPNSCAGGAQSTRSG